MINSVEQLNKFAIQERLEHERDILPRLIERQELISFEIAKLLTNKTHPLPIN